MAVGHYGNKLVAGATAANLTTLLSITPGYRLYQTLVVRADSANGARIYFGPTNGVTAAGVLASGYLAASEGLGIDIKQGQVSTDDIYFIGNGTDVFYVDLYE